MFRNFFKYTNKDEKRNFIIKIIIVIAFLILSIIILIIATFTTPRKQTRIDNLYEYINDFPKNDAETIYSMLYDTIKMNSAENTEIPTSGALLRPDSLIEQANDEMNVISGNFIVDINSIRQSYYVQYTYSPNLNQKYDGSFDDTRLLIACVPADKTIYKEFNCKEPYNEPTATEGSPITSFLPYNGTTPDGNSFIIGSAYYPESKDLYELPFYGFTIRIYGKSCGDPSKIQPFIDATSKWMESLNFKLEDYQYEFIDTCPQSTHDE